MDAKAGSALSYNQQLAIDYGSGIIAGVVMSWALNPWDRALYLSTLFSRPFLLYVNFTSPYHGFWQALVQRAFINNVYYVAQGQLRTYFYPYAQKIGLNENNIQLIIGSSAGIASGIISNPVAAIKAHTWGNEKRKFLTSAHEMWHEGGLKSFTKGTRATIGRDIIFGSSYEIIRTALRNNLTPNNPLPPPISNITLLFSYDLGAAAIASILAGPFNYARTLQYGTAPNIKPLTIPKIFEDLWKKSKRENKTILSRLYFFQREFKVGWGTARIAVGMSVGQLIFDNTRSTLQKYLTSCPVVS